MANDIATIMVPVDRDHPSDAQLRSAGALASEIGAGIIGISACEHMPSFYFAAGAVASDLLEEDERRMREGMAEAEKRFRKALPATGVPFEWRSSIEIPIDFIARESRAADLILCFARREAAPYSSAEIGELVLKSGRPTLVVPEGAVWQSAPGVLIAWKDTREARRAVRDALPFLRQAKEVCVLEIIEGEESERVAGARVGDVAAWLQAHDIAASMKIVTPRREMADEIDAAAHDFDADLIVAGAYGHSRLGEWIFGGATRYLLTSARRQLLLTH